MRVDPGKTATSAVRSGTSTRQVLACVAAEEGNYGILQTGFSTVRANSSKQQQQPFTI